MYYKNRNKELSADMGAMLNNENAAGTLSGGDIVRAAESLPVGGLPPYGQRPDREERVNDYALMQAMYPKTAKLFLPYVKAAVKNNIYSGSPALRPMGPDREFVSKVTNEAVDAISRANDEAEEICLDSVCEMWNKKQLLYDLVSTIVLTEIFLICRQKRKK